jgi:hypothetical protein
LTDVVNSIEDVSKPPTVIVVRTSSPREVTYGLNPLVNDADGDKDEDTFSNLSEYLAGTNPSDPSSNPGLPTLGWTGETGYSSDGLHPETGSITTTFVFKVLYKSLSNKAPLAGYPKVHIRSGGSEISGSPFTMTKVSGDYLSSPISFNSAETGGDGAYAFKAVAMDFAGNSGESSVVETLVKTSGLVLTEVEPDPFGLGAVLTLSGRGFGEKKGTVLLGDSLKLKVLTWSDTSISCTVSKGLAGTYLLKVVQKKVGESNTLECTLAAPLITAIDPQEGGVGTPVTISGHYFGAKKPKVQLAGGGVVKNAKVTSYSDGSITFLVPKVGAGIYEVKVLNGAGMSEGVPFEVK